ncbi:MAG TPA: hypothetical protein PKJ94_10140 [Ferruginibacter sp.]|nr:hypothetical protein [Ferruginibacter sp.]
MTRIALITLFTLLCACIAVYAIWTVKVSQTRSDNLLAEFKKIDNSLKRSNDSLQHAGIGAFRKDPSRLPEVELAIKAKTITSCIDSIRHEVFLLAEKKEAASFSYPDKKRLLVLKNDLVNYNRFIQEKFPGNTTIKPADFIGVENMELGGRSIPWEVYHFENTTTLAAIIELKFISMQVQKLRQKALQ